MKKVRKRGNPFVKFQKEPLNAEAFIILTFKNGFLFDKYE